MALVWHCDSCGKETHLNPPVEMLWDNVETEIDVPYTEEIEDPENPGSMKKVVLFKKETHTEPVPRLTHMKVQNGQTGEVEDLEIQDSVDLKPRAYLLRLSVGNETIQKDFCKECLDSVVLKESKALWDKLASIGDID